MNRVQVLDRPTMAKLLTVKFANGMRDPETHLIPPGVTAGELLKQLQLGDGFQLSKGTPDTIFGKDEPLYGRILDGDLLFVTPAVDAGRKS